MQKQMQATDSEKFFSSVRESCLNAILRVKVKYNERCYFSCNEMLFSMQKTDFHVLALFAEQVMLELHAQITI